MVKVGYTGKGMISRGVEFQDGNFYDVEKEFGLYLVETFPNNFTLIENAPKKPTAKKQEATKKPARKTTRKTVKKEEDK